jgi:hypothetical protein
MIPLTAEHLVGRWIQCMPFLVPRHERFPQMVLRPNGTGVLEDGDYPAVYSIDEFDYELTASTVLRF